MTRASLPLIVVVVAAGCATPPQTHPVDQYAVVHATIVAPGSAARPDGRVARECLLDVRYYSHRADEPTSGAPAFERMSGLRPVEPSAWVVPASEADDAFRGAGYRCVHAPKLVATLGQEATMFVGESIRIPAAGAGTAPQPVRVGFQTVARPEALPNGDVRLEITAESTTLLRNDPIETARIANSSALDLPPGYVVILRLTPTDGVAR